MKKNKKNQFEDITVDEFCSDYTVILNRLLKSLENKEEAAEPAKKGWFGTAVPETSKEELFLQSGNLISKMRERVYKSYDDAKKSLVDILNEYYHQKLRYGDYFDGTEIAYYPYATDSIDFCRDELMTGSYVDFSKILIAHSNFNSQHENVMKYEALVEMFNEILQRMASKDKMFLYSLSSFSPKSKVSIMSESEVLKLCVDLSDCHLALLQDIEASKDFGSLERRQSLETKAQEIVSSFENRFIESNSSYVSDSQSGAKRLIDIISSASNIQRGLKNSFKKVLFQNNEMLLLEQALKEMCCDEIFAKVLEERGTFDLIKSLELRTNGFRAKDYETIENLPKINTEELQRFQASVYGE